MNSPRAFAQTAILFAAATLCAPLHGAWPRHVIDDSSRGADGVRLADVNRDGLPDIATGWEQGGVTRLYLHPGYSKVTGRWSAVTVGATPAVEDAALVDLDRDGALDIVSSCETRERCLKIHWAPPQRDQLLKPEAWNTELFPPAEGVQLWMFCLPLQIDGKRGVDLLAGGKGDGAALGWFQSPADPKRLSGCRATVRRPTAFGARMKSAVWMA